MQNLIAKELLSIGAVFLRPEEPFTWASGIKSPVYCDNRLTLTSPKVRLDVENALAGAVKEHLQPLAFSSRSTSKMPSPMWYMPPREGLSFSMASRASW